ncbi:uncharacterized protein L3040_000310 [Drepanopeziza brunnea f. sp. 'multigermtubi']|uniref:uncharacterized protein n=1 Tax=Drepanopeziza brunnea f. sp. 'multigermtubi' TaxID=698441 RepID=UPI0023A4B18B|nr:hypothetical protein L3040_000310 [Drepanopeziza brunnea f. sp. 'multigermtubi']
MPHINGRKYSCEPCIRGHRATSCAHTDRILVAVRKPGRPLESCGHNLNTCQCGKVAEVFGVENAVSNPPSLDQFGSGQKPNHIVTTPPAPTLRIVSSFKAQQRTKSQSRITKRPKKRSEKPLTSPPSRTSIEASSLGSSKASATRTESQIQAAAPTIGPSQQQYTLPPLVQPQISYQPMPYCLPTPQPYQVMHPLSPTQGGYLNYQRPAHMYCDSLRTHGPREQSRRSDTYAGKIEDVSTGRDAHTQYTPNNSSVRSPYLRATQDTPWRATAR